MHEATTQRPNMLEHAFLPRFRDTERDLGESTISNRMCTGLRRGRRFSTRRKAKTMLFCVGTPPDSCIAAHSANVRVSQAEDTPRRPIKTHREGRRFDLFEGGSGQRCNSLSRKQWGNTGPRDVGFLPWFPDVSPHSHSSQFKKQKALKLTPSRSNTETLA